MRINKYFVLIFLSLFLSFPKMVSAQGMMGQFFGNQSSTADISSTAQDEAAGKLIFDKLQSNQTTCQILTDDDFDVLGDYYMGQMAGSTAAHAQMNARMTQMMGEEGEKQAHIALGKRLSGCNSTAAYSNTNSSSGFAPMMGYGGGMMSNFGYNYDSAGLYPILFWSLIIIIAIVLLSKYFYSQNQPRKKSIKN